MSTVPTLAEIDAENDPQRAQVLKAIRTVLTGTNVEHPGKVTIAAVAAEAGVAYHQMQQGRFRDLRYRFKEALEALTQEQKTPREAELKRSLEQTRSELAELRTRHEALRHERDQWRAGAETVIRTVVVLKAENKQLERTVSRQQEQLRKRRDNVVDFPSHKPNPNPD
ncbi:MAG: hypothetical protein KDB71_15170 [Mycobacterium sp.]|nr:hypothetical protein [Mycobacterium sp.]